MKPTELQQFHNVSFVLKKHLKVLVFNDLGMKTGWKMLLRKKTKGQRNWSVIKRKKDGRKEGRKEERKFREQGRFLKRGRERKEEGED